MHRPGSDPNNMTPDDFLCDYCGQPWAEDRPLVEGHKGSCICGNCLTVAYTALVINDDSVEPEPGEACALCLGAEEGTPHWRSPVAVGGRHAIVCRRCVKQSAGVLQKDPEIPWSKPGRTPPAAPPSSTTA